MEEHGSFRLVLACGIYFYLLHFILCADRERSLPQQSSPSLYFPEQDGRGDSPGHLKSPCAMKVLSQDYAVNGRRP